MPELIRRVVEATHHECDNGVCKQVSFTYGSGFPALWEHENLNEETHEWLKDEFAEVPIRFFNHIKKCVAKGHLIANGDETGLPDDFEMGKPQTDARFVFFAGEKNRCFLPESQVRTYNYFNNHESDRHALHLLPTYSHLDVFMGKEAAKDVFPLMVHELENEG